MVSTSGVQALSLTKKQKYMRLVLLDAYAGSGRLYRA